MIKLLVGLGNPGPDYEASRHNAGFWWLDAVAQRLGAQWLLDRGLFGRVARTSVNGRALWLLQPMTFMNRSGQSVGALARFYKIEATEVLVVHDELDLPAGEAKLKRGGGHAGHNGLRDIHAQLGSADYWRLRLGIGHPGDKSQVANWVLKKPSTDERIAIEQTLDRCSGALTELLTGDMDRATAKIHTSKPPRPKPTRPSAPSEPAANAPPSTAATSGPEAGSLAMPLSDAPQMPARSDPKPDQRAQ